MSQQFWDFAEPRWEKMLAMNWEPGSPQGTDTRHIAARFTWGFGAEQVSHNQNGYDWKHHLAPAPWDLEHPSSCRGRFHMFPAIKSSVISQRRASGQIYPLSGCLSVRRSPGFNGRNSMKSNEYLKIFSYLIWHESMHRSSIAVAVFNGIYLYIYIYIIHI